VKTLSASPQLMGRILDDAVTDEFGADKRRSLLEIYTRDKQDYTYSRRAASNTRLNNETTMKLSPNIRV